MTTTYVGTTLSGVSGTPASEDASGYTAQSFLEIGKIVSISEVGDTSDDVTVDLLKPGRRGHANGVKDLGEISVVVEVDNSDAGQTLVKAANNTNNSHSFKIADADGEDVYFYGLVANYRDAARSASGYKGASFVIRGQSGVTRVTA